MINKSESGAILYAVAYEVHSKRGIKTEIEYIHADNQKDARLTFLKGFSSTVNERLNIVGIAPSIGYMVHDNHGEKLSV